MPTILNATGYSYLERLPGHAGFILHQGYTDSEVIIAKSQQNRMALEPHEKKQIMMNQVLRFWCPKLTSEATSDSGGVRI